MFHATRPASPRRRAAALSAALLYVVGAVAVPVVHAQTEDLRTAATVEAAHSQQCDRIHSDLSCPASGALRALPSAGAPVLAPPVATLDVPAPPSDQRTVRSAAAGPDAARAPPA